LILEGLSLIQSVDRFYYVVNQIFREILVLRESSGIDSLAGLRLPRGREIGASEMGLQFAASMHIAGPKVPGLRPVPDKTIDSPCHFAEAAHAR